VRAPFGAPKRFRSKAYFSQLGLLRQHCVAWTCQGFHGDQLSVLPRLPQAYARAAAALGFELGAAPHTQRDFSLGALPGGYRRLLHRPADLHFRLLQYGAPDQALAASDLELLRGTAPPPVAVLAPGAPRAVAHTYHNFWHRCMPSHTHCCCARRLCANARELSAAHGAYWAPGRADLQTTHHQLAHCFYVV